MLQAWLVVAISPKFYTVYTILFHKYVGSNIGFKIFMSHFSMFVPTKANVKIANVNMGHAQVIGIILCNFTNWPIIYPVVPVYYCPGHPSNTISLGALRCYVVFQKVTYEPLEHCDSVEPRSSSWRSSYKTRNNLDYLQIKTFKVNHQINNNLVVPTVYGL